MDAPAVVGGSDDGAGEVEVDASVDGSLVRVVMSGVNAPPFDEHAASAAVTAAPAPMN